jgi:hypothetical protein
MAEATGVEIPKGSPDELRAAGTAWSTLADLLEEQAGVLDGAATAVVGADWHGDASAAYALKSTFVGLTLRSGAGTCKDAAAACRHFAHALRDAQHRARDARRRAEHALDRRDAARRQVGDAEQRIADADAAAVSAAHRATSAAAGGPTGAGALAAAQADGRHAAGARDAADTDLRRAREHLHDAERDLRHARKDGEEANEDAERAGRKAAQAFGDVAAGAEPAPLPGVPVPVSLRGASPDMAGLNGGFGGPFHGPGRFGSPGDARAAQIARQRAAAADAAEAAKPHKGSILDGLSGLANSASLGIVDLGGDKDSDRYRGGDLAGYIPITVGGVVKIGGKIASKVAIKTAKKEAAEALRSKALKELREKKARSKARDIHLDKGPGETFAQALMRHEKARKAFLEQLERQNLKRKNTTDLADIFSQGLETLAHHRPGGIPTVLSDIAKNWPAYKAGGEQAITLLKKYLRE